MTQGRQCLWCREGAVLSVRIEGALVEECDLQDCQARPSVKPTDPPHFFTAGSKLEKGLAAADVLARMGKPSSARNCVVDEHRRTLVTYEERGYRCDVWLTDGLFDVVFARGPDSVLGVVEGYTLP
ncbi:MAG: hypothetical protein V2A58_02000 [Planctomycetota bacterium]